MRWTGGFVAGVLVVLLSDRFAMATLQDANSTLGFESAAQWTIRGGTILGTSPNRTQGTAALSVQAPGYTVLTSRLLGPLGQVSQTVSLDLGLPSVLATGWAGATQLFVSVPSQNINNAFIGQVELTGLKAGKYNRISFRIPDALLPTLRGNYSDLTFSIVLNVPNAAQNTYLLDNLEVSSSIPPVTTVGPSDLTRILGFESQASPWTITSGTILGLQSQRTEGNFALAMNPHGYSVLTSPPLTSLAPIASSISFDLYQPAQTPTPSFGAAQLYVSIPSQGVNNAFIGQADLTHLPYNAYSKLTFPVPSSLVASLNAQYSDLRFSVALNLPATTTQTFWIDNFQVGSITKPPDPLPPVIGPGDLVGTASSGIVTVGQDGTNTSINIASARFVVSQANSACTPSATQACRYVVIQSLLTTAAIPNTTITSARVENGFPFEVIMGGSGASSLSAPIPSHVPFYLSTNLPGLMGKVYPGANATIAISPSGAGMISVAGQFSGNVDGHAISLNGSVTASSPLANRPPVAAAGPDRTVTSSNCSASITLDGTGTTDPDNNIVSVRWFDGIYGAGVGLTPKVKLSYSGVHTLTLEVVDSRGSRSTDQMQIVANLGNVCTTPPPPPPTIR